MIKKTKILLEHHSKLLHGFNFESIYTNGDFLYIRLERCASKFITGKLCVPSEKSTLKEEVIRFKSIHEVFYIDDVYIKKDFIVPRIFVVVRHPYERFLSTLDMVLQEDGSKESKSIDGPFKSLQQINNELYKFFDNHNPLFVDKDKFVDQVIGYFYNNHDSFFENKSYNIWKPQTNGLLKSCPGYNDLKILKLEKFEDEYEETFDTPYVYTHPTERKFFENYILTKEQKEKLKKIYELDFKNFDYD